MSKLPNIIQRRELEPLLHKADKIAKHYEKASNCTVSVLKPDYSAETNTICFNCKHCKGEIDENGNKICALMHIDAVKKAKASGGCFVYSCPNDLVFWASPFYSGERFAGAFISGGIEKKYQNNGKVKALAKMMSICADQISALSFTQKNISRILNNTETSHDSRENTINNKNNEAVSMDMERMFLANLRRGDTIDAKKLLYRLLHARYNETHSNLPAFRLKALELTVLITRAVTNPEDLNDSKTLEISSKYQQKINESTNLNEIETIMEDITEKMSEKIFSFQGVKHFSALRKAERYIWNNYTRKISLTEIAKASGLSAPYFSTIFKEEMGENLSDYLNRLRVEKAAVLLLTTNKSIGEIAKTCGFEDQSWFSKIFKNNTGFTPGKYRDQSAVCAQGNISGLSA